MKIGRTIFIVFLGLIIIGLGLVWINNIFSETPPLERNAGDSNIVPDSKNINTQQINEVKKENNCGDSMCSKGESYKSCSKDCGYSLLDECIKSCVTNQQTADDKATWENVCRNECNTIEIEYESMRLSVFSQEERDFMQKEKENMLKTFIEGYKNV